MSLWFCFLFWVCILNICLLLPQVYSPVNSSGLLCPALQSTLALRRKPLFLCPPIPPSFSTQSLVQLFPLLHLQLLQHISRILWLSVCLCSWIYLAQHLLVITPCYKSCLCIVFVPVIHLSWCQSQSVILTRCVELSVPCSIFCSEY